MNMPPEALFEHCDIHDLLKEPLALFAGAGWAIPRDGRTVAELGSLGMVWKALRNLERCEVWRRDVGV
jgi:hypothetical protein